MAKKDVELFFEEVSKNEALKKELAKAEEGLNSLGKSEIKTFFNKKFLPIIKTYGFNFTYQDLLDYKQSLNLKDGDEISDDFLNQVSGGKYRKDANCGCAVMGMTVDCMCIIPGAGGGNKLHSVCACLIAGGGVQKEKYKD